MRACLDETNDDQVITLDSCPAGRVIYIASAAAGHSYYITWRNSQCYLDNGLFCSKRTYHPEIMQCNGRRDCSITRKVFNQWCWNGHNNWQRVNFIDIKYTCLTGKSTTRTFYDSAFRVYFIICSCRILSSKNCKY